MLKDDERPVFGDDHWASRRFIRTFTQTLRLSYGSVRGMAPVCLKADEPYVKDVGNVRFEFRVAERGLFVDVTERELAVRYVHAYWTDFLEVVLRELASARRETP